LEPAAEDRYQNAASLRRALLRWRSEQSLSRDAIANEEDLVTRSVTSWPIISVGELPDPSESGPAQRTPSRDQEPTPRVVTAIPRDATPTHPTQLPALTPHQRAQADEFAVAGLGDDPIARKRGTSRIKVVRRAEAWNQVFSPTARGYTVVGLFWTALAAVLITVLGGSTVAQVVGWSLLAYGVIYLLSTAVRRWERRQAALLGVADGQLRQLEVVTTALGDRYVALVYSYRIDEKPYLGRADFTSRAAAEPFLQNELEGLVRYNERRPHISMLRD
jgi:hypothetical protein